jgi:hypothetical protein
MEETSRGPLTYYRHKKKTDEVVDISTLEHGTVVWEEAPGTSGRRERILMRRDMILGVAVTACVVLSPCEYREQKQQSRRERALTHKLRSHGARIVREREPGHNVL